MDSANITLVRNHLQWQRWKSNGIRSQFPSILSLNTAVNQATFSKMTGTERSRLFNAKKRGDMTLIHSLPVVTVRQPLKTVQPIYKLELPSAIFCQLPPSKPPLGVRIWKGQTSFNTTATYRCAANSRFLLNVVSGERAKVIESTCHWNKSWSYPDLPRCVGKHKFIAL